MNLPLIPIDVGALSPQAQKLLSPSTPPKLKEMAARGIAPGFKPGELIAVLVVLAGSDADGGTEPATAAATAKKTLEALPEPLLAGALSGDLLPWTIDALARIYAEKLPVLEKLLAMPSLAMETAEELARSGEEDVTELIALNEERLLKHPRLIELLYLNKRTRASTADRIVDLAVRNGVVLTGLAAWKEASAAIQGELIPEPTEEPTPDDILFRETQDLSDELAMSREAGEDTHVEDAPGGKEVVKEKFLPLYQRIAAMTVSQKVRRAILGSKEERMLLIRDANRVVATAAARSPLLQEVDAVMIARNKNIAEDVLRILGTTPQWLKSYSVKKNLVENPKTPTPLATHLLEQLRESDLRSLSKSKNVTGAIQEAARRHLNRRST